MSTFAERVKDHAQHPHCASCAACMYDPQWVAPFIPLWCVGCTRRIEAALPDGAEPPWAFKTRDAFTPDPLPVARLSKTSNEPRRG